tara:strand:+ start:436 stop:693 length:258 start_codon:yes stop_codon:yes gene_type:complete
VAWPKKQCQPKVQVIDVADSGQVVDGTVSTDTTNSTEESPPQVPQPVIPSEDKTESIETMRSISSHVGRSDHSRWASSRTDIGFH